MLYLRSDEVTAMRFGGFGEPSNGQVVGLRAAGEQDHLVGASADESGHFAPRPVHGRASLLAEEMDARRVAVFLSQVRQHRVYDARVNRRRRAVVQINSA